METTTDELWINFWQNIRLYDFDVRVELAEESSYLLTNVTDNTSLILNYNEIRTPIDFKNGVTLIFLLPNISINNLSKFPLCSTTVFPGHNMSEDYMQEIYFHLMQRAINAVLNIRSDGRFFQINANGMYHFRIYDSDLSLITRILEFIPKNEKFFLTVFLRRSYFNVNMRQILLKNALRFNDIILTGIFISSETTEQIESEFKQEQERQQRKMELRTALRTPPLSFSEPILPQELIKRLEML